MIYPTFIKGQVVDSAEYGRMTFIEMHKYYGKTTTYEFSTAHGTHCILPEQLADHFGAEAYTKRIEFILEELRTMRDKSEGELRHTFNEACDRLDVLLSAVNEAKDNGSGE